jgi:regulator of sigma E protease
VKFEEPAFLNEPVVAGIIEYDSPGERADIRPGDKIIQVNDLRNPSWDQFALEVATSANRPMKLEILRSGETIEKVITPQIQGRSRGGYIGVFPFDTPFTTLLVKGVASGKPAAQAGIQPGDKITKIGDLDLEKEGKDLADVLRKNKDEVVRLTVVRRDQELTIPVRPYKEGDRRFIGIERDFVQRLNVKTLTFNQALHESVSRNIQFTGLIFDILQRLFKREVSLRMLEGPIGIARQSGIAAKSGFSDLIFLMAAISLNLGIMNLLPIPVLDGGVIAIILIETLIRRDLSLPIRERITQVGFVVLLLLAVVVTYNDIIKTLPSSLEKYFP